MTLSYQTLQFVSLAGLAFLFFCSPLLSFVVFGCFLALIFIDCDVSTKLIEIFGTKPESSDLRNCVIWITGASSGIGEMLAYELSRCGATLVLSARNVEQLETVAQNCKGFKCKECLVLPFNLIKMDEHEKALEKIINQFGKVDILINNAGRSQRGSFLESDLELDRELFELDYFAQMNLTRIVVKQMVQNNIAGQIAVVTSVARYGVPFQFSYCGAKAALHGAFESLRVEFRRHGINVLFAVPGPVESNISENAFTNKASQVTTAASGMSKIIDHRMSGERCARLISVSLANRCPEVWIVEKPYSFLTYLNQYMPTLSKLVTMPLMERRLKEYEKVYST